MSYAELRSRSVEATQYGVETLHRFSYVASIKGFIASSKLISWGHQMLLRFIESVLNRR